MSQSSANSRPADFTISGIRVYGGGYVVFDVVDGRIGRVLLQAKSHLPDREQDSWRRRLLDATTVEQADYRILDEGTAVAWPQLDLTIAASNVFDGSPQSFQHRWNLRQLQTEIASELIRNCWFEMPSLRVIELRPNGQCVVRRVTRGGHADLLGELSWVQTDATRFCMTHVMPTNGASPDRQDKNLSSTDVAIGQNHWTYEYNLQRRDHQVMELLVTRKNSLYEGGPQPVWWKTHRRPKAT